MNSNKSKTFFIDKNNQNTQCSIFFSKKLKTKIHMTYNIEKDEIFIKAPFFTSDIKIKQAIEKNYKKLMQIKNKKNNNEFININKNIFKFLGKNYYLHYYESNKNKLCWNNNDAYLFASDKSKIKTIIEKFLKNHALKFIPNQVNYLANKFNLEVKEVKIRKLKRAWANCKYSKKELCFSYNLMHFDIDTINYVICHELAHLIYPNHSKMFWNKVSMMCPNYLFYKKKLKEYVL